MAAGSHALNGTLNATNHSNVNETVLLLNMLENSVDDQYSGCREKMLDLVEHKYLKHELKHEKHKNEVFSKAWEDEEWKGHCREDPGHGLTKNHCLALRMLTSIKEDSYRSLSSGINDLYESFRDAVRKRKISYRNLKFKWYSMQFLVTDALQILNNASNHKCKWTYHGTKVRFHENVLNKEIRLGSFVSTSVKKYKATQSGTASCFEIYTCHGASMVNFSIYDDMDEVLIPPYEKFEVINTEKSTWCDTVYVLNSTGTSSKLNCVVFASVKWYIRLIMCLFGFALLLAYWYYKSKRTK
ncbi:GPI-linked NAD(P)(+)--arginine ADP-ribosyltransferase 1-like [Engraulis encrasicolus]|uniref:GPI-linked NAD(P)(+)--arginine ADP-ribosyltransferase 1-like n=1 Tax=Engraulis encrasicolus TaxID=184585 RepID=UPI002FCF48CB